MSISAGKLTKPVIVERLPEPIDLDSAGQEKQDWETFAHKRAEIYPLRGREYFSAQEVDSEVTHRIVMRWDSGFKIMNAKYRVRYGDRTFDVQSMMNINEANREIQMMAIEQGA